MYLSLMDISKKKVTKNILNERIHKLNAIAF